MEGLLGKIKKEWKIKELQFWKDFGISLKTLQKYKNYTTYCN